MSVTPRVNGAYIGGFRGQTVRVVGRITAIDPQGVVQLEMSDHQLLNAYCTSVGQGEGAYDATKYNIGNVIEVVGLVQEDGSVQEYACASMGQSFGQFVTSNPPAPLIPSTGPALSLTSQPPPMLLDALWTSHHFPFPLPADCFVLVVVVAVSDFELYEKLIQLIHTKAKHLFL
jgi:hypothetical protein